MKWCPLSFTANGMGQHGNTESKLHECIEDKCALWRWETKELPMIASKVAEKLGRKGYCGLGGPL